MLTLVTFFLCVGLIVLPGAWIACTLPSPLLSWASRVALCIVLSPVVLAAQFVLMKSCGAGFDAAVVVAQWTALLGLAPLLWRLARTGHAAFDGRSAGCLAGVYFVLAVIILTPEIRDPQFGVFGRHALMHAEICYQMNQPTVGPEEPQLAGVPLAYPWLFHIHWAVMGYAGQLPPTTVDTGTKLVYLACFCIFFWETVRRLGAGRISTMVGLWLVTLGTNMLGRPAHLAQRFFGMDTGGFLTGDSRYTPLLAKFAAANQMPLAMSLLGALLLLVVSGAGQPRRRAAVLICITLTSIGLMYPPVFLPTAAAMVALAFFEMWPKTQAESAPHGERWFLVLGGVLALGIVGLYGQSLVAGRARAPMRVAGLIEMLRPCAMVALALGPQILPALWAGVHQDQSRKLLCMVLALGAGVSIILNVSLQMPDGWQYKFMLCAAVFLGPLTALGLDAWFRRWKRFAVVLAVLLPLMLVPWSLQRLLRFIPEELKHAPKVRDDAYYLTLHDTEPHAGWTRAVREQTPVDTVVIARTYHAYVPAFTARSVYVSGEVEGGIPGYGMGCAENMVRNRGYSGAEYQARMEAGTDLFLGRSAERWEQAWMRIGSLKRPVAWVLEREPDQALAAWLMEKPLVSVLWQDDRFLVLFLARS